MEEADQKSKNEARFIKGMLLGCGIIALLVVGGCVAFVYFLIRTMSRVNEYSYEAPPSVEVSDSYANPEVIRLFLGLASGEEAAAIPPGSYRLTEGEINAYLKETMERLPQPVQVRVKLDSEALLIYYSMALLRKDSSESTQQTRKRKGLLPENLQASYMGRLRAVSDGNGVRLAVVSFKMGKLPETPLLPEDGQGKKMVRPMPQGMRGAIPGTDAQRIIAMIFEGVSYGPEVASVDLKPLEVQIQVRKVRTSSSP
jgi:hypothetical protein